MRGTGTPDERVAWRVARLRAWWMRASVYHRCVIRLSPIPMPKHVTKLLLVLSIAMVTSGCGILYKQPIYQGNLLEKANVDQLQAGMSKQQVTLLLGSPSIADPFHHDRWDYTASQRVGTNARNWNSRPGASHATRSRDMRVPLTTMTSARESGTTTAAQSASDAA